MRRIALGGLLAVGLVVLVLLGTLVWGGDAGGGEPGQVAIEPGPEQRVRVEVLNAAGIPRLAQRGTDRLRDRGFDVVYYGNARGFHPDTTLVLNRTGDEAPGRSVAEALGVGEERVRQVPDSMLYLEVTVILGSDWLPAPPEDADG